MRMLLNLIFLCTLTLASFSVTARQAHSEAGVLTCVNQKLKALRGITPGNAQGMLYRHFSVSALAIAAYGGGAKWKANPQDHKKVLARFQDGKRIAQLAKSLGKYKKAKVKKVTVQAGRTAIVIAQTSAGPKTVTVSFSKQSCAIVRLCVSGSGCAHELFKG